MQSNQNHRLLGLQVEPILGSQWTWGIGELVPIGLLEDAIGGVWCCSSSNPTPHAGTSHQTCHLRKTSPKLARKGFNDVMSTQNKIGKSPRQSSRALHKGLNHKVAPGCAPAQEEESKSLAAAAEGVPPEKISQHTRGAPVVTEAPLPCTAERCNRLFQGYTRLKGPRLEPEGHRQDWHPDVTWAVGIKLHTCYLQHLRNVYFLQNTSVLLMYYLQAVYILPIYIYVFRPIAYLYTTHM